jgi:hypothetical protein
MHRRQHRVLLTMTAGMATLILGAAPAFAGSDGCSGDDCEAESSPPPAMTIAPVPVAPQPSREASPGPAQHAPAVRSVRTRHGHRVRAARVAHNITVPRGAVAAGAGGTAPAGPDGVLALLGTGALVLVATGGGLVATSRRSAS